MRLLQSPAAQANCGDGHMAGVGLPAPPWLATSRRGSSSRSAEEAGRGCFGEGHVRDPPGTMRYLLRSAQTSGWSKDGAPRLSQSPAYGSLYSLCSGKVCGHVGTCSPRASPPPPPPSRDASTEVSVVPTEFIFGSVACDDFAASALAAPFSGERAAAAQLSVRRERGIAINSSPAESAAAPE